MNFDQPKTHSATYARPMYLMDNIDSLASNPDKPGMINQ